MKLGSKTRAGVKTAPSTAARALRVLFIVALASMALPIWQGQVPTAYASGTVTIDASTCNQNGLISAISQAGSGGTVNFSVDCSITLTASISISQTVTIDGSGHNVTIDGGGATRIFVVTTPVNAASVTTFTLNNLTLSHGNASGSADPSDRGGAILVPDTGWSSGATNWADVSVNGVTFDSNDASDYGAAIESDFGNLSVTNSTFMNNTTGIHGGAINNNEVPPNAGNPAFSMTLTNDTFASNSSADGGAIALGSNSPATITNSTLSSNSATGDGDAIFTYAPVAMTFDTVAGNTGSGSGLGFGDTGGRYTFYASILANNGNGGVVNCGSNQGLISDSGSNLAYPNSNNCAFVSSTVGNPQLGALQNYGGPTQAFALTSNSPAIGLVANCGGQVTTDQRGVSRPSSGCDAGAFQETPNNCAALPNYSSGFSSAACLTVTQGVNTTTGTFSPPQNPAVANNVLSLTNGAGQGASAFYDAPIDMTKPFITQFDLVDNGTADGATFTMQSATAGALGCNGGDLGVGYPASPSTCGIVSTIGTNRPIAAITPSVDVEFDLTGDNTGNCPTAAHVAFGVNGDLNDAARGNACYTQFGSVAHVWVSYDGSNLNLYISSGTTQPGSPTISFPSANLSSVLGSNAYMGFTGATGASSATISVNNWSVSQTPATPAPVFTAGENGASTWGGTTANPLVITGTAPAGSGVSLFSGAGCGGTALGTAVADGSGNWSIPVTGLSTGPVSFSANASAQGSGISACATPITVIVDRTAPSSTVTFPGLVPNTPYLNAGGWTAGCGTPAVDDICGTASDGSSGVAAVFVAIENSNGQFWNGTDFSSSGAWVRANGTTNWNVAVPRPTDGVYTVASAAIDNAGNTEAILGTSLYGICDVSGTGGQLSLNGGQLSLNGGLCTVGGTSGGSGVSGQLSLNGGQLSLNGGTGGQLSLNGGQLSLNGGQLSLNGGTCTVRDNTGTSGTLTIAGGTLSSSGGQLSLNGGQLSLNGGLEVSGGQLSLNGGQLSLNGGQLSLNGGQLSLNGGDCTVTATGGNSGQLSLNGGQLSLNGGTGVLSLNGGQLSLNGGQLSLNGGQLSLNGGQLSLNGGAGASSELGNVVVDTTPPTASVTVDGQTKDNSVNIDPASTVHVSFNEAMAPSSITGGTISLSPSANPPTCGSDTLCQNVTLDGLSSATAYTLTISGATDLAGNPVTPLTFNFTTAATGPVANVDTDGDGIPDAWDGGTVSLTGGRSINTGTWGFTPTTKDLCVVENYMSGQAADGTNYNQAISQAANQLIVNAFQRHGIHVVIFEGDAAHSAGLPSGYTGPYYGGQIAMTDPLGNVNNGAFDWRHGNSRNPVRGFEQIRSQNFVPTGLSQLCHYAVIAHSLGGTTSTGSSRGFDGSDFVVALAIGDGGIGSTMQQAGTVMHELGHNLGLHHGGAVSPSSSGRLPSDIDTNHKPNYLSVMNYNYQFTGVLQNTASANNQPCTVGGASMYCLLDYSESALPQLNKGNLNELTGIGAPSNYVVKHECPDRTSDSGFSNSVVLNGSGPVDWNCNFVVDPFLASSPESFNINADSGPSLLNGYDDWDNLNFLVGTIGLGLTGTGAQGPEDDTSTIDVDPSESGGADVIGSVPEVSAKVQPAAATITWSNPADITYGTALSSTQLNASSNLPGTISYLPANGTVLNPGAQQTLTATFTPTDTTDFSTTTKTVKINVLYQQAGATCDGSAGHQVLQPVNATGATSVFKQGSTVPLKFRVCDAGGNSVGPTSFASSVVSSFGLTSSVSGTGSVNESTVSATADTSFRWDSTGQQWIYNLSTKSLTAGYTYTYTVTLNDGTQIPITFGLR